MRPLVLFTCALVLAGCGSPASSADRFKGAERAIAETVEDMQRAGERREADRMCRDFITAELQREIAEGGENCAEELEKAMGDADAFELEVEDVTVTGSTGTAEVRGQGRPKDTVRELRFEKVGDRWRAAAL